VVSRTRGVRVAKVGGGVKKHFVRAKRGAFALMRVTTALFACMSLVGGAHAQPLRRPWQQPTPAVRDHAPAVEAMGFVAPTAPDEEDGTGFVAPTAPDEEDGTGFVAPTAPDEEDGAGFVAPTAPDADEDDEPMFGGGDDKGKKDKDSKKEDTASPSPAPTVSPDDELYVVDDVVGGEKPDTSVNHYIMEFLTSDIFFFSASVFLFLCCIVLYLRCFKQSSLRHPDEKAAYSQLSVFDPNDDDAIDDLELEEMK